MLHRQAGCVPPGSKDLQVPRGRESSRNRDQARAPRSQRWQQPQTRGTPSPPPQVSPGCLARQGPREQAARTSPPIGTVPHNRPHQRLPPKEKQTFILQHLWKPKSPLEKAEAGAPTSSFYRVGMGLQPAGLSALGLNCQQLEARPWGLHPLTQLAGAVKASEK